MKNEKSKRMCILLLPVILAAAMLIHPPVFYLNDDVTIRSILSGAYTGIADGHAVYMKYPLTGILAFLYRIFGGVSWLELFFALCMLLCMILLADCFAQPIIGCLTALAVYMPFCLYMHYTLIAALAAGTAVFLLAFGKKGGWPIVLLLLSCLIRSEAGLLSLPFAAGAMVWRVILRPVQEWRKEIAGWFRYCIVFLGALALCLLINSLCYASPQWEDYLAYNDSRTLLYDYTDFLSTEHYGEEYTSYGMSREEYQILYSYDTMVDGSIDKEKMKEVADAVYDNMQQQNSTGQKWKESIRTYYIQMRFHDQPYNYLCIAAYVLLGIGFLFYKKWLPLSMLVILGAGRSSIWLYLIQRGRFPERVSLSLYAIELLLLLGMGVGLLQEKAVLSGKGKKIAVSTAILFLCILCGGLWKDTADRVQERTVLQKQWNVLKEYCGGMPQRLYLVDVFSTVEYSDMQYAADPENMMLMGGWMSASPLAANRLEKLGAKDAAEALFYKENVSLIAEKGRSMEWLEDYLCARFGACSLEEAAVLDGGMEKIFIEYRIRRHGE